MASMEVLLREDVLKVGRRGDVVKVSTGYGRNYLIPRGMATTVSEANKRKLDQEQKKYEEREAKRIAELTQLAEALAAHSVTIEARANEDGHLFGSVSYEMIQQAFKADGHDMALHQLEMENTDKMPIKEVGIYTVKITLHPEITTHSKVWVVEESDDRAE